jgi:hypothetical protein
LAVILVTGGETATCGGLRSGSCAPLRSVASGDLRLEATASRPKAEPQAKRSSSHRRWRSLRSRGPVVG